MDPRAVVNTELLVMTLVYLSSGIPTQPLRTPTYGPWTFRSFMTKLGDKSCLLCSVKEPRADS